MSNRPYRVKCSQCKNTFNRESPHVFKCSGCKYVEKIPNIKIFKIEGETEAEHFKRYWKKWYQNNKEKRLFSRRRHFKKNKTKYYEYSKKYRRKTKLDIISHYGGKCFCCGETRWEFLSIDHVKGNGNKHRREELGSFNKAGFVMYRWLIKNKYPDGFQILCMNCNTAKGFYGYCPHLKVA